MRRSDARSAQIGSPDGISNSFQVSANSGEPFTSIDEFKKSGPQMSFVGMAFSLSRARKRLTRTGTGPDFAGGWPACELQGVAPPSDASEKVALRVACKVAGLDFFDAELIYFSFRY